MDASALTGTFEPTELAFMQRVFDNACTESGLAGGSLVANELAVRIIQLYRNGIRDEDGMHFHLGAEPGLKS